MGGDIDVMVTQTMEMITKVSTWDVGIKHEFTTHSELRHNTNKTCRIVGSNLAPLSRVVL